MKEAENNNHTYDSSYSRTDETVLPSCKAHKKSAEEERKSLTDIVA